MTISIGDTVQVKYNSGKYIGEVLEDRGDRFLVKVHAVQKHPKQGDLHNLGQVEDVFFHERKALAHYEKMNVVRSAVRPFDGKIPDYAESLQDAIDDLKQTLLQKNTEYNELALTTLKNLEENDYTNSYYK
ncbi:sporulation phosphorelay system protein KapB [Virgibacillus siamensis]|uniref:sporulation phosphorelay system protein KapB n=1 Tax=Virgibacillus siamensis TaxID=480071 RepID=UPI000986E0CA|nr:sporulation phosphorelay system protein KapB [Virgibacillus siamensis]